MRRSRNITALALVGVVAGMLGLTAAAVPLYRLFCQVTGYGGTTQRAEAVPGQAADVLVQVDFNADVGRDLPWRFRPAQRTLEVRVGEEHLAYYEAENLGDQPIVGRAVFNVTPHKAGFYFAKLDCFCFTEQTLQPGEKVQMPVSFFVDPAMLEDRTTSHVRQITLSYTFFVDPDATKALEVERPVVPRS